MSLEEPESAGVPGSSPEVEEGDGPEPGPGGGELARMRTAALPEAGSGSPAEEEMIIFRKGPLRGDPQYGQYPFVRTSYLTNKHVRTP